MQDVNCLILFNGALQLALMALFYAIMALPHLHTYNKARLRRHPFVVYPPASRME